MTKTDDTATPTAISPENRPTPRTTVEMVRAIAEKYRDTPLPGTSQQYIVLQEHDGTPLAEKMSLTTQLINKLRHVDRAFEDPALNRAAFALIGMDMIRPHTDNSAGGGFVFISPKGTDASRALGDDIHRDLTWSVLHEVGHLNMSHLDEGAGRYSDFQWDNNDWRRISGWERSMPVELLVGLRDMMSGGALDAPKEGFDTQADYEKYMAAVRRAGGDAVKHLHTVVNETYADAFAVLSHSVKEGVEEGLVLADKVLAFRKDELRLAQFQGDDHDSTRGLEWLSSYLRGRGGQHLVGQLGQACDKTCASEIHQTSLLFAEMNVGRWAKENGMAPAMAERLSSWVGDYLREGLKMEPPSPSAVSEPTVYAHDRATILKLGATLETDPQFRAGGERELVRERSMGKGY